MNILKSFIFKKILNIKSAQIFEKECAYLSKNNKLGIRVFSIHEEKDI